MLWKAVDPHLRKENLSLLQFHISLQSILISGYINLKRMIDNQVDRNLQAWDIVSHQSSYQILKETPPHPKKKKLQNLLKKNSSVTTHVGMPLVF